MKNDAPTPTNTKQPTAPIIRGLEYLGGCSILFVALFQLADVIGRYFLTAPISGGSEILGFILAGMMLSSLPVVFWKKQHVRVTAVSDHFPSPVKFVIEIAALGLAAVLLSAISLGMFRLGQTASRYYISTPDLGIPKNIILYALSFGFACSVLAAILLVVKMLIARNAQ